MKILFVMTGGTIGSTEKEGIADVDEAAEKSILKLCRQSANSVGIADLYMEVSIPMRFLSENADHNSLSEICTHMLSVDYDSYDGVIVTHGSDTLIYTAAMLGHALSWVKIPIVITAADYIISDPRSNAADNISAALIFINECIKNTPFHGVFAAWKNRGETPAIHQALRLIESEPSSARFWSFGSVPVGVIENNGFTLINKPESPIEEMSFLKDRRIVLKNNVIMLHSYPGLDYSKIMIADNSDKSGNAGNIYNIKQNGAVLLKLYHSGTACMSGEKTSFRYLVEKCREAGKQLYIAPAVNESYSYRSAEGFIDSEAVPIFGMSEAAAYTALLLAYSFEEANYRRIIISRICRKQ